MMGSNSLVCQILGVASILVFVYLSFGDLLSVNYKNDPKLSFVERNGTNFVVDGKVFYPPRIREMLQAATKMGLTVCRTWAFNDGDYNALQVVPGQFDERVFKTKYVKWAWDEGVGLSASNDSFDPSIRLYFKNYVKTILTRKNTITGVVYRDDPTIFGWELINEPRCITDASGDTLQVTRHFYAFVLQFYNYLI
ncbi:putative mannan endo-1,4-beta-mannosidase [Helianthus annuus]|nr:putative mannan endo-1,4-beta-mannosidase [Helianthus annuus]